MSKSIWLSGKRCSQLSLPWFSGPVWHGNTNSHLQSEGDPTTAVKVQEVYVLCGGNSDSFGFTLRYACRQKITFSVSLAGVSTVPLSCIHGISVQTHLGPSCSPIGRTDCWIQHVLLNARVILESRDGHMRHSCIAHFLTSVFMRICLLHCTRCERVLDIDND